MGLTNYVPERNRVYVRRFDHEEAQSRYQAGESIHDLAAEYGVTAKAVSQAVTPEKREHRNAVKKAWRTGECETCGSPAMRLVSGKAATNPDGRVLCGRCRSDERRERLGFDGAGRLVAVRCVNHDCAHGERWQPPQNFPRGSRSREVREGGIHSLCRDCQTRKRREYRHRHFVPCEKCGTPTSPANKEGRRSTHGLALCRSCSVALSR